MNIMLGQKTGLAYHPKDEITLFYVKKALPRKSRSNICHEGRTPWSDFNGSFGPVRTAVRRVLRVCEICRSRLMMPYGFPAF